MVVMRTQITPPTRTLLIDNHDSYTFNLYQLIAKVNGEPPTVVANDDDSCASVLRDVRNGVYDSVVISPGPGTPHRAGDVGFCPALLEVASDVPVLGVCLGMQLLAAEHGARVTHAPAPVHGRLSSIQHTGHALFHNIPSGPKGGFDVVRYHSLAVVEETLPSCLHPIAWTCGSHHAVAQLAPAPAMELPPHQPYLGNSNGVGTSSDRVLMAIAHADRPHYGVQFHPESIATAFGHILIDNFRQLTQQHRKAQSRRLAAPAHPVDVKGHGARHPQAQTQLDVAFCRLPEHLSNLGGSDKLFCCLYGSRGAADTFWLDSSDQNRGRFSYMGGRGGPLWQRINYRISSGSASTSERPAGGAAQTHGVVTTEDAAGHVDEEAVSSFFCWLERRLEQLTCSQLSSAAAELPFDFCGGFVGYLGYELKSECGFPSSHTANTPDAAMFLADRFVVVDHHTGDVYLLALHEAENAAGEADAHLWLEATARAASAAARIQQSAQSPADGCSANGHSHPAKDLSSRSLAHRETQTRAEGTSLCFRARQSRAEYVQDVQTCLQALYDGESYELCLTTMLTAKQQVHPLSLYRTLRRMNPAPYAAWLSFGDELQVCCSSPERFLRGGRGKTVEAKPIKGTARRKLDDAVADAAAAAALEASEKDRAENLMIVDLLRNDLGRVCEVGTVHVPALMRVESFATVHQLVSTDASIVDCLRATFPGGSMTGAPKQRSVAILDKLEGAARGIYSGILGFIGVNDTFDFNIVIRTAVVHKGSVSIGAGGAVVVQSDPEDEYEEMELKAAALIRATEIAADLGAP